ILGKGVDISFYNKSHLPIGIIIGLLMGFSLLLRWKTTNKKDLFNNSKYSFSITILISLIIIIFGNVTSIMLVLFTLSTVFSLVLNTEYLYKALKRNFLHTGAFIAHIGIAVFLLGVIATGGFTIKKTADLPQGKTVNVLGYNMLFTGYQPFENNTKYAFNIEIETDDVKSLAKPVMYIAEFNNSLMREPDILNFITKDFYIEPLGYEEGNTSNNGTIVLQKNVPFEFEGKKITFTGFNFPQDAMQKMSEGNEFTIGATFEVVSNETLYKGEAYMKSKGNDKEFISVAFEQADLHIELTNLDAGGTVAVKINKISAPSSVIVQATPTLSVEVSVKPFINLVWLGVILMVIGFTIAAFKRIGEE
nr:cytochrome c-type biogenesis CcmF C-terminal domain-containing protein [Melioribacteraceae bacterium]